MDSIDVTSPEFSLGGINELNETISDKISLGNIYSNYSDYSDYAIYIYLGVLILISIIGYFIYKTYLTNGGKRVTFQDKLDECYAEGVCQR
jgi:hypothetical protein